MTTRQPPLFPDVVAEDAPPSGDRAPGVPDPQCPRCAGSGVILVHSEWCRSESCTIERHKGDCHGTRRKCRCMREARVVSPALPVAELFDRAMDRIDDQITIIHGDCRDILPTLDVGPFWIVTDPPYGIGYVKGPSGARPANRWGCERRESIPVMHDDEPFDPTHLLSYPDVLMWGANHYAVRLPTTGRWLAWDKVAGSRVKDSFSDVDFAWHSRPGASRIISYLWKGVACVKKGEDHGYRWHPTLKPVGVMLWSMDQARVPPGGLVVDPYAGSGSTGVACLRSGRRCILIEKERRYIPIIRKRTGT
jgi:site-specific DNA-methyltransferase (adenine-specific)